MTLFQKMLLTYVHGIIKCLYELHTNVLVGEGKNCITGPEIFAITF